VFRNFYPVANTTHAGCPRGDPGRYRSRY